MPSPRSITAFTIALAITATSAAALTSCGGNTSATNPRQITWYINPDSGGNDPTKHGQARLAAECTKAAKGAYTITTQVLPNSASDQRQQLLRRLAASDPGIDLMSLDPVFVAEFAEAGFLEPVPTDKRHTLTDDAVTPIVTAAQWKNTLFAAPMWANTQILWYRKSVAKAAGLDMTKPVSWDQVIHAAASQKKTLGVQASRYEGYSVWINALIESANGKIVKNSGATGKKVDLGINSPAGKRAAEIIHSLTTAGVGGPALSSSDETAALDLFIANTSSGFLLNWPYVWAALAERKVGFIDDVAWARYPQSVAGQKSRPPLGGIELGVNAASTNKPAAWEAIQCITNVEHQTMYMLGTGNPAARKKVYDNPTIRKKFPMADLIRDSLDSGAPRPVTQYYGDISTALQRTWSPPESVDPATTPAQSEQLIHDVLHGEALL
ncbi:Probable ABC transporter-binding protein DR_1438 precursor [Dermatophilus congolensis]|uniref:Probable ABC transporter-binding protein DR_1438 n=1 Tax=Dermatophilus congolensis TaxID=1863 RepID=A0A239VRH4_9MICO|nr:extracellular solute-binding protein [Dermatophilus congolensis]SNV24303.1 Probable ABC transporter-binding protein DR_1438 precursor [Dermatophilus congolensis]